MECGNHEELMKKKGHYYDMVMLQTSPETDEKTGNKLLFPLLPRHDNIEENIST